jgi:hypothetical protein
VSLEQTAELDKKIHQSLMKAILRFAASLRGQVLMKSVSTPWA